MKKGIILLVLLVSVLVLGFSQTENTWTVNNTATWVDAVNGVRNGGNGKEHTITIIGNVSIPGTTEWIFGSVTGITITIEGNGVLSVSSNGYVLTINGGQSLIVKDVTLRGRDNNNRAVIAIGKNGSFCMEGNASVTGNSGNLTGGGVYVDGGTFIMRGNSKVTGNTISGNNYSKGAGVYVKEGTFTMQENAMVTNNINNSNLVNFFGGGFNGGGGGVFVDGDGTFNMQDNASVSNNNAANSRGGGVCVFGTFTMQDNATVTKNQNGGVCIGSGTFTMNGGTISENSYSSGGGVLNFGKFIMQNGTISSNNASSGGGIYNAGEFTMMGGTISNNTSSYGGGVFVPDGQYSGTFNMQGGTISGNTTILYGGGVYMGGLFTMQGNASVSDNITSYHGGGVYLIGYGYGDRPFTMKDSATVSGNRASGNGGGLYVASGRGGAPILDRKRQFYHTSKFLVFCKKQVLF